MDFWRYFFYTHTSNCHIPYSSKFSWHNIFGNFMIRHPITKFFSQKCRMVCSGHGFTTCNHKIFTPKINICVIFNVFTKFLDHKNLEPYGSCTITLTYIHFPLQLCISFFQQLCIRTLLLQRFLFLRESINLKEYQHRQLSTSSKLN